MRQSNPQTIRHARPRLTRTGLVMLAACFVGALSLSSGLAVAGTEAAPDGSPLVVSELQTTGYTANGHTYSEDPQQEFIELHNQSSAPLPVQGWRVTVASPRIQTVSTLATLDGAITAGGYMLLGHAGFFETADVDFGSAGTDVLAKANGVIRLVDPSGQIVETVAWGGDTHQLPGSAIAPAAGHAIQRHFGTGTALINTGNNSTDFSDTDTPSPHGSSYTAGQSDGHTQVPPVTPLPAPAPSPDPIPATASDCQGAIISEILPNPAGADNGREFIELRNPTGEAIPLGSCSLQTSGSKKTYQLPSLTLEPGEYRVFSDADSGLTLPNAAGGIVWLLSPSQEVQSVAYPADLPDDVAWALVDGSWVRTYMLTPGGPNLLLASQPCPSGQERNPQTNRCDTIVTTQPGEPAADNPETPSEPVTTTPAGTAASTLVPCKAGQERNPDTNRCRKSAAASGSTVPKVSDIKSGSAAGYSHWILAGLAVLAAAGYAAYEWRQEITAWLGKRFGRGNRQPGRPALARS